MSKKFKAVVIDNQSEKFTREIKEIDTSHLKDGNILVKIDYSSLNYKDALILNNGGKIVSNVSKKLDYLIIGEKPTKRKIEAAKELKIKIIDQSGLNKLLDKSS